MIRDHVGADALPALRDCVAAQPDPTRVEAATRLIEQLEKSAPVH
jgi:hypothetical protein